MAAPESEMLHEIARLRCELEAARLRIYELALELEHARGELRAYAYLAPVGAVA